MPKDESPIGYIETYTQNDGYVQIPVYEPGLSGRHVEEMYRTNTDSGVGFIPLAPDNEAAHNFQEIPTQNHGVRAPHDHYGVFHLIDGVEGGDTNIEDDDWSGWSTKEQGNGGYITTDTSYVYNGTHSLRMKAQGSNNTVSNEIQAIANANTTKTVDIGYALWHDFESRYHDGKVLIFDDGTLIIDDFFDNQDLSEWFEYHIEWDWPNDQYVLHNVTDGTSNRKDLQNSANGFDEFRVTCSTGDDTDTEAHIDYFYEK